LKVLLHIWCSRYHSQIPDLTKRWFLNPGQELIQRVVVTQINIMSGPLVISLKDELLFIKSLLIPAFNPKNNLDTPEKRDEWLANRAEQKKWDAEVATELIERYGTVASLEVAERKLEEVKAERLQEKAEENEKGKGKTIIICSHSSFFTLFLSFPCLYLLVLSHVVNHVLLSSVISASVGQSAPVQTGKFVFIAFCSIEFSH